jgi:hypothetical protein
VSAAPRPAGAAGAGGAGGAAGSVDIDLPCGWDHVVHHGPVALVARPRGRRSRFTPTLTVTRSTTPGVTTLGAYRDAQLAGLAAAVGGHLVDLATSNRPRPHLDLTLAIESCRVDVTVTQRHLVEPRPGAGPEVGCCAAVVATATAADHDWPRLAPVLVAAVRSIRATST